MKFRYIEKKVDVSDALREYAEKKVSKLEKYFRQEADVQITFTKEGQTLNMEMTIQSGGTNYRVVKERFDDLYAAVDDGVAAIERQIHKFKTRLEKRLRQGAFEREIPPVMSTPEVEEESDFPIVRVKKFALNPMSPEEAILQMNLLAHTFFMFRNAAADGAVSVVYRRQDGGYGMIEEE